MRHEITTIIESVAHRQLKWCTDYIDDHSIPHLRRGDFYEFTDQILSLISEEIEKAENPFREEDAFNRVAAEALRQEILSLLKE